MSYEIMLDGNASLPVKRRNPWGVLGLSFLTLGIYHLVWWYKINKEMMYLGRARQRPDLGDSPGSSVCALIFGGFGLYIPTIWTIVTTSRRIRRTQEVAGVADRINGWLLAAIYIFTLGVGSPVFLQYQLNKAWRLLDPAYGSIPGTATVTTSLPAAMVPPPPPPPPPPLAVTPHPAPTSEKDH